MLGTDVTGNVFLLRNAGNFFNQKYTTGSQILPFDEKVVVDNEPLRARKTTIPLCKQRCPPANDNDEPQFENKK